MAYLDKTSPQDRAASIASVVAIHAALGYALVVGLTATGVIDKDRPLTTIFIPETKPPPPPEPTIEPQAAQPQQSQVYTPPVPIPLPTATTTTTVILPPHTPEVIPTSTPNTIPELPTGLLPPTADPIAARPRGNPGGWIGQSDYRTSWINRDMTGIARFRLGIGVDGRVESCTITRSTGHAELDAATCALLRKRARFEPARDGTGARTQGTFASSVEWRIPD